MKKVKYNKFGLTKEDLKDVFTDLLAIRGIAQQIWGNEIRVADDYLPLQEWQYRLGRLVTTKDLKKEFNLWLKSIKS